MTRFVHFLESFYPVLGLGMISLVLGYIGLLLFFMPVLSLSILWPGLFFGGVAMVLGLFGVGSLRWSLAGVGMCLLGLGMVYMLVQVPEGRHPNRSPPRWQPTPETPDVAPPAGQSRTDIPVRPRQHG